MAFWLVLVIQIATAQNISNYSQVIKNKLTSLYCDGLSVGGTKCDNKMYGVQNFINSLSDYFQEEVYDTSNIVEQIINKLDTRLNTRGSILRVLSSHIQQSCVDIGYINDHNQIESIKPFDDLPFGGNLDRPASNLPTDIAPNPLYGNNVSLTSGTYRLANNVDYKDKNIQKDAQISALLDRTMKDLHDSYCVDDNGNQEYCSMYFGTINSVFFQFPGVETVKDSYGKYRNYDPRFRPWYVSAASGSKNVIILMDKSASMRENKRLALAKSAVISVLNTLGPSSYVSVITFDDIARLSCFGRELVSVTSRNVAELIKFVNTTQFGGQTNFTAAFDVAFSILEKGSKGCHTTILFLTDGDAEDVTSMIKKRNTQEINAVIFSYTLGNEASDDVPKKVADLTNGFYTHIDDEDESLITVMSSYYLYFPYVSNNENIIM
eukprot:279568_1